MIAEGIATPEPAALAGHVVRAVQLAAVDRRPFCHFYVRNVFPEAVYDRMHGMLPAPDLYHASRHVDARRDDGTVSRSTFNLEDANLARLDPESAGFWRVVFDALASPAVKAAIFGALAPDIGTRFGIPEGEVGALQAFHHIALLRDAAGYRIRPHPDTATKIVTAQIYLPEDDAQAELGTSLYVQRRGILDRLRKLPPRFAEAKRFRFLPNSGFAFAVSENSWHGREPLPPDAGPRHSLALVYYDRPVLQGQGYD